MSNSIVKFFKYILWAILWIISAVLVVWLAKSNRNISTYIGILNQKSLADFWKWQSAFQVLRWDSTSTWSSKSITTWVIQTNEDGKELDVYDPKFEEDMQDASLDAILSGEDSAYWFKADSSWSISNPTKENPIKTWTTASWDAQKKLMELIRQNEMKK